MACTGTMNAVSAYLQMAGPDRARQGNFALSGEPLAEAPGGQVTVGDATVYYVGGEPFYLAPHLQAAQQAQAQANPSQSVHRAAFAEAVQRALYFLREAQTKRAQGDVHGAREAINHAECDLRVAYTEANYGKRDDAELEKMTQRLDKVYPEIQSLKAEIWQTS